MNLRVVEKVNKVAAEYTLKLPSSKSLANRVFILAAQAEGSFVLHGDFEAEDVQLMIHSLQKLGIEMQLEADHITVKNDGSWRLNTDEIDLYLGNSGTCSRFLASLLPLRAAKTSLSGKERLHERPIKDLIDALALAGVRVDYLENEGFLPLEIHSLQCDVKKSLITIKGNISSQYLSSLLLSAASYPLGMEIEIVGELISRTYVDLTLDLLRQWGIEAEITEKIIRINHQKVLAQDFVVEGDASAAVYWWAFGFLHNCEFTFENLPLDSRQGDVQFVQIVNILKKHSLEAGMLVLNMDLMPDASLMLMALVPQLDFPVRIEGIGSLKVKETDRIEAMATELRKINVGVKTGHDWIEIQPLSKDLLAQRESVVIETYDDHRIAMSMAILGTKMGNLKIAEPQCVEKTYPHFWDDLDKVLCKSS